MWIIFCVKQRMSSCRREMIFCAVHEKFLMMNFFYIAQLFNGKNLRIFLVALMNANKS